MKQVSPVLWSLETVPEDPLCVDVYCLVCHHDTCLLTHLGESEAGLAGIFAAAAALSPSIVFIDEIDAIAPSRDAAGHGGASSHTAAAGGGSGSSAAGEAAARVLTQLLVLMDGLGSSTSSSSSSSSVQASSGSSSGSTGAAGAAAGGGVAAATAARVVVIAATNRPAAVDPALRRPGRFVGLVCWELGLGWGWGRGWGGGMWSGCVAGQHIILTARGGCEHCSNQPCTHMHRCLAVCNCMVVILRSLRKSNCCNTEMMCGCVVCFHDLLLGLLFFNHMALDCLQEQWQR